MGTPALHVTLVRRHEPVMRRDWSDTLIPIRPPELFSVVGRCHRAFRPENGGGWLRLPMSAAPIAFNAGTHCDAATAGPISTMGAKARSKDKLAAALELAKAITSSLEPPEISAIF